MKKCFESRRHQMESMVSRILIVIIWLVFTTLSILLYTQWDANYLISMMFFLFGSAICLYLCIINAVENREYIVDPMGIQLTYAKVINSYYSWNEISEITVCDVNYSAKDNTVYDVAIRLSISGRNARYEFVSGCNDRYSTWRKMEYNLLHFRDTILIEYSKNRIEEIHMLSGLDIQYALSTDIEIM